MKVTQISLIGILVILTSCSDCNNDEIWRDKVELPDGSHVMVYHTYMCNQKRPFFCPKDKMIDFVQMKFDVFDYCFSEEDIRLLIDISKRNVKHRENYFLPIDEVEWENQERFMNVIDTTYHPHKCYYSLKENKLVHLKSAYQPSI